MMFKELIKDLPEVRVKRTKHARPILASHAPKVRIRRIRNVWEAAMRAEEEAIKNARDSSIASRDRRAIKRWKRWVTKAVRAANVMKGGMDKDGMNYKTVRLP